MRQWVFSALFLLLSQPATASTATDSARLQTLLRRINGAVDCSAKSSDVLRHACGLWRTLRAGKPLGRLSQDRAYLGVSIFFPTTQGVRAAIQTRTALSALAIRRDGRRLRVRLTALRPTSKAERDELARVGLALTLLLKGQIGRGAPVSPQLRRYLQQLSQQAAYPLTNPSRERFSVFTSTVNKMVGRIYRVTGLLANPSAPAYVVVEFALDGIHLSFFSDSVTVSMRGRFSTSRRSLWRTCH